MFIINQQEASEAPESSEAALTLPLNAPQKQFHLVKNHIRPHSLSIRITS